jgi:hypothetical protein
MLDPADARHDAGGVAQPAQPPRPPAYAWRWLQRSRPVLTVVARQLTGEPPGPGFVDELRQQFEADPFVRDVVIDVVADVAFGGRVAKRRPPGAVWDRGLVWWAAAVAGVSPSEYDEPTQDPATQRSLF